MRFLLHGAFVAAPQVFFSSSTMKQIIAPAALEAAQRKGTVRSGWRRRLALPLRGWATDGAALGNRHI